MCHCYSQELQLLLSTCASISDHYNINNKRKENNRKQRKKNRNNERKNRKKERKRKVEGEQKEGRREGRKK